MGKRGKKLYFKLQALKMLRAEELMLDGGIQGILVSCRDTKSEKRCVNEVHDILDDLVELLYPDVKKPEKEDPTYYKTSFLQFLLLLKGLLFFLPSKWTKGKVDVKRLGEKVLDLVFVLKEQICRYVSRFIPVSFMMKAKNYEEGLVQMKEECKEYFSKGNMTWSLEFKARGNKKFSRELFLDPIYKEISASGEGNSVDLKTSNHSIVIEIVADALIFAICPRYKLWHKYNLTYAPDQLNLESGKQLQQQEVPKEEPKPETQPKPEESEPKQEVAEEGKEDDSSSEDEALKLIN